MLKRRSTQEGPASPYPLDLEIASPANRSKGTASPSIYFDGVFKGDYSLAVVNRCLADALIQMGAELTCFTSEAGWLSDPLLNEMPEVRGRMRGAPPATKDFDVHIRNTWPPSTRKMCGRFNAYVCFAWEESEFPADLVERFNRDLDLVMVASAFVKHALVGSGVTIPVEVVGEGSDHVLKLAPPSIKASSTIARLLHVSSGFSRKGIDCLIEAYHRSFTTKDNVELVIKTFANPDNAVPKLIADLDRTNRSPPIRVIEASYSYPELLGLYQSATALVAPSRGEGFGLPMAEAMALGLPVITTNYSGQVDFCRQDNSWLVDYTLAASKAHVSSSFGLWAEPDAGHLGRQLQAVLAQPVEAAKRAALAKVFAENHLTWKKTAQRALFAIAKYRFLDRQPRVLISTPTPPMMIDVVTSWGRNCGIATYASHLYGGTVLSRHVSEILAQKCGESFPDVSLDGPRVSRIWSDNYQAMLELAARIERGDADVLWVQHHPGHFSTPDMHALTRGIRKSRYRMRAITFHSVVEAQRGGSLAWCQEFDVAFVHSAEDAEALSKAGHRNPVVIPHGFVPPSLSAKGHPSLKSTFDIGSFGFLTPHKNIDMLVRAFALAIRFAPNLKLHLFNCMLPNDPSRATQAIVENLVGHYGLTDSISRQYDFIPEHRLVSKLSQCDLFVFPYGATTETATGAARMALSANKPILCSRSAVLRDLHPVSHVLKDLSVEYLAEALVSLSQSEELLSLYDHQRSILLRRHSYERTAQKYLGHILRSLDVSREHRHAA